MLLRKIEKATYNAVLTDWVTLYSSTDKRGETQAVERRLRGGDVTKHFTNFTTGFECIQAPGKPGENGEYACIAYSRCEL